MYARKGIPSKYILPMVNKPNGRDATWREIRVDYLALCCFLTYITRSSNFIEKEFSSDFRESCFCKHKFCTEDLINGSIGNVQ